MSNKEINPLEETFDEFEEDTFDKASETESNEEPVQQVDTVVEAVPLEIPARKPIIDPYIRDADTKANIRASQNLPGSGETAARSEDILAYLVDRLDKLDKDSVEYTKVTEAIAAFYSLNQNCFDKDKNYERWFENYLATEQRSVDSNGSRHGIVGVKQNSGPAEALTGDYAIRHVAGSVGTSIPVKITCYASGIRLHLNPFTTTELSSIGVYLSTTMEKIGKSTAGYALSGDDVFIHSIILETILSKISYTNIAEVNKRISSKEEILRDLLKITDIYQLQAGILYAMYPKGYPIFHPCIDTQHCNYTLTSERDATGHYKPDSLIKFNLITHSRTEELTSVDHAHWAKPEVTIDEVKAYQSRREDSFNAEYNSLVNFSDSCFEGDDIQHYAKLEVPDIGRYMVESSKWANRIESHISSTVNRNRHRTMSEKQHEAFVNRQIANYANEIQLGKHAPYIKYIEVRDLKNPNMTKVIQDREAIYNILTESYSQDPTSIDKLSAAIDRLKETRTMTLAGVPNFACPNCGTGQVDGDELNKLIPINLTNFFYDLMLWRSQS